MKMSTRAALGIATKGTTRTVSRRAQLRLPPVPVRVVAHWQLRFGLLTHPRIPLPALVGACKLPHILRGVELEAARTHADVPGSSGRSLGSSHGHSIAHVTVTWGDR